MDFTGRFARITEDYAVVANYLGLERSLPVINKLAKADYSDYGKLYSSGLIDVVTKFYADDLINLGYKLD